MRIFSTLFGAIVLVGTYQLPRASACGGFFCDNAQPVVQAAERIVFQHDGAGNVTAIVQIQYQGTAERFAWVLPVPGRPDVGVSSNIVFTRLLARTNPTFRLQVTVEGECGLDEPFPGPTSDAGVAADAARPDAGSVMVVDEGTVGPYDYVTISLDPEAENPGDAAVTWLQENGFDVDDMGRDTLGPYLAGGMNLIAFRLTKGQATGSIRPIRMTYRSDRPMIPIRPTAVAATPDMGVLVWVLGAHRAVPVNYRHLVLNEARINWFNPNAGYNALVSAAADEAGGQGFVTEMADRTALFDGLFNEFETTTPSVDEFAGQPEGLVLGDLLRRYQGADGIREAALAQVPVPDDATIDDVLNCSECYYTSSDDDIDGFDVGAFLTAIDENVVAPIRLSQELLLSRPWFSRMYTTMSAAEMTVDPEFDFNSSLASVSNQHVANQVIECHSGVTRSEAGWRVELSSGDIVRGTGRTWPLGADDVPALRREEQLGAAGLPEVTRDESERIAEAIRAHNATVESVPPPGGPAMTPRGDGCSAGTSTAGSSAFGLVALALLWARRRKA